jgi:putative tricarboxylic transport membrane protein
MGRAKDINAVLTGVFLILVALLAFYLAWPLSSKTEVGLGPGFVPKMIALIQLVLGGVLVVDGFLQAGVASEPWQLRPPLLILGSIGFFAATIERQGLVVALTGLVLISCLANRGGKFYEAVALAFGAVVLSVLLFVKALGLSIPLWPQMPWGD